MPVLEQLTDKFLQLYVLVGNNVFGNNPFQFLDLGIYVAFGGIVGLVNAQTQTNARICRQIRQLYILGKRILPVGNLFGKNRLGNSSEQQGLMKYRLQIVVLLYQRNYLVLHQVAHLEGNARHGEEEFLGNRPFDRLRVRIYSAR